MGKGERGSMSGLVELAGGDVGTHAWLPGKIADHRFLQVIFSSPLRCHHVRNVIFDVVLIVLPLCERKGSAGVLRCSCELCTVFRDMS